MKPKISNGTTLMLTKKNFRDGELSHKLFQTTRQRTKIRNTFANNVSIDIKPSNTQLTKIFQSSGFLCNMIGYLGKKALMNPAVPLTKDVLPKLATKVTWSILDQFERKLVGKEQ